MALTLTEANRIVQAAVAKSEELNVKVSVAVCDAGGHLLAFNRMEGASWLTATVAQGKAVAATGFSRPSGALPADSPVVQAIVAAEGGRLIPAQGALPLFRDGELIGAVGASGATAQQDEDCSQAGVAAL